MNAIRDRTWKLFVFCAASVFDGSSGDALFRTKYVQKKPVEEEEFGQGLSSMPLLFWEEVAVATFLGDNEKNNNQIKRQGTETVFFHATDIFNGSRGGGFFAQKQ